MSVLFFVFGKLRTGTLDQLVQRCAEASPSLGKFSLENLPLFHIKREKLHFGGHVWNCAARRNHWNCTDPLPSISEWSVSKVARIVAVAQIQVSFSPLRIGKAPVNSEIANRISTDPRTARSRLIARDMSW